MAELTKKDVEQLLKRYAKRLSVEFEEEQPQLTSKEYLEFIAENMPKAMSWYEKLCNFSARIFKMSLSPARRKELEEHIKICHLNIPAEGVDTFAILAPLTYAVIGAFFSFVIFNSIFFSLFFIFSGLILMAPLRGIPKLLANSWRMKASNQMVLCVFYIVTFMRHTSNLEGAINFASQHLIPPLSLDLKKVIWDVEAGTYESVRESLDMYLESWRKWNMEFIESLHLIESSLFEGTEERRLDLLDKALDVILSETYEKMLHYAHNLKSPITMLHMLGIILPILGLVILPLIVSFMGEVKWYHLSMLYNIILPISIFYIGKNVLSRRPTGYGTIDISKELPQYQKYENILMPIGPYTISINPIFVSIIIIALCLFIAFTPLFFGAFIDKEALLAEKELIKGTGFQFLGYRESIKQAGELIGPYGVGAAILSFFFPIAFGIGFGLYFLFKTNKLVKIREEAKKLEKEFASALFQLGGRLADGMPAEMAFGKVAQVMEGTVSAKFFEMVSANIQKLGMGVEEAIFNPRTGALVFFPSKIINSSMKVLVESVKKGPRVAAQALSNIARYIKEIHRVDERLKDLMAEIISSMKSQINFMAPAISGVVIGITSMITTILGRLREQASVIAAQEGAGGRVSMFTELFGDAIPTYYFQIVVGIYVVQIIFILSILSNGIENGSDKLSERYWIGKYLIRSTLLYCIIALIVMILFNFVASSVVGKTVGMG